MSLRPAVLGIVALVGVLLAPWALAQHEEPTAPDCVEARQSHHAEAEAICQRELAEARGRGDAPDERRALFQLSILARLHGDHDRALSLHEAIQRSQGFADDWQAQYRLAREQGILAYAQGQSANALTFFRAALAQARARGDRELEARSLNDLGSAYRRLGAEDEALDAYRRSLELKRELGDAQIGTTLSNIADLLVRLGDPGQAEVFYGEALEAHRVVGAQRNEAHTLESIALLADRQGQLPRALTLAREAHAQFERVGSAQDRRRSGTLLAEIERSNGALDEAARLLDEMAALAAETEQGLPARWSLTSARLLLDRGRLGEARSLLEALEADSERWMDEDRLARLELMAGLAEAEGELGRALALQKRLSAERVAYGERLHDRELVSRRVLLEVAEAEHRIGQLQVENQLQQAALASERANTRAVAAVSLLILVLLLIAAIWWFRRRSRRERQARARLEARIERYRDAARALRTSSERLSGMLDATDSAVIAIGVDQRVLLVNSAAMKQLGCKQAPIGQGLDALFGDALADGLPEATDRPIVVDYQGRELWLRRQVLELEEEVQVLVIEDPAQPAAMDDGLVPMINRHFRRVDEFGGLLRAQLKQGDLPEKLRIRWQRIDEELQALSAQLHPVQEANETSFREHLVQLMVRCLETWERETGSSRVELAEQSGIWRVTIDEGRLRTRAMDRYLQLAKLPRQPRWREVLRTAYFILSECPGARREELEAMTEQLREDAARLGLK
ncbi:tetratricopeptide repeat protein [Wenzhouxiangella marina]|uniref:Uncharacterized protein n=1 Tax=Wenzhouxiangella marina TaxID=1579979 RepID=A0A0K0XV44_9GAMM|nr:tetratricopeptide repeat protein [Wenzhouxiangella marina]AKS41491.1 hypothetical protein WM2015_1117 [Wenzhouxiangella marina]MBB6086751.1 hypothetical protein [Wenzhouxiangella marina]